jgi:cold shock CspA family protein
LRSLLRIPNRRTPFGPKSKGTQDSWKNSTHGDAAEHEHVAVAIKDAFSAAQRQIEDAVREMRCQVKPHEPQDHGRASKFLAGDDYGFIETADGREVYFHRNSVLENKFDRLTVGSEVRFVEEIGEKSPQATRFVSSVNTICFKRE